MVRKTILSTAALIALVITSAAQAARTWTDTTGKFQVSADLVAIEGDSVRLDLGDRKTVVPLARLSEADREFVKDHLAAQQADSVEAASAKSDPAALARQIDTKVETTLNTFADGKTKPVLHISLLLTGAPAQSARSYGRLYIKTLTDGNGKPLKAETLGIWAEGDIAKEMFRIDRDGLVGNHPENGIQVEFLVDCDDDPPTKLAKLVGTVLVETGGRIHTIERKVAFRGPVKDKALTDFGIQATMGESRETVGGQKQKGVSLRLTGAFDRLDSVNLVASDGGEISDLAASSRGSWGDGIVDHCSYDFSAPNIPTDAKLRITYRTGAVKVAVPFDFENVEVPTPRKR